MTQVFLWETKTSSEDISFGSTFWKRTTLDPQLSLYLPAVRAMGHDVRGCVYDVLRKPDQKPSAIPELDSDGIKIVVDAAGQRVRTKDGKKWRQTGDTELGYVLKSRPETPEEYGARCLEAIAENPQKYYARGVVVRLEADEREAAADIWNTAQHMREARRLNIYPRNPDSCIQWGRECDYLNVCSGITDIKDPLLFKFDEDVHEELASDGALVSSDLNLLTQSFMRAYRKCPRLAQLRYILRMRPIKRADTLSTGHSVHAALDVFRRGGDRYVDAAIDALETEDPYVRAKERAMIMGYAAYWGPTTGVVAIEKLFQIPLINPATGAASKTFSLGGKVDAIVEAEAVRDLTSPV